jgi:hypothetical protein
MPHWLRQFVVALAFWLAWITGRRYDALARRMGRPVSASDPADRRRFVIIQIDGLAHEYLLRAIAGGHMPALQRMLAQGSRLQRWCCGLPSTTPAVQAGLMYGDNWDIPAFRWYEKETGYAPQCKSPSAVERLKVRVAADHRGILAGGSSYTNMFDGDARLALFTISAMGRQRFFEHLRGLGWALLFALIPWRILRIIALSAWELARDVARTIWLWGRGSFRKRLRLDKPVLQVVTNIIFGEIQTFGVVLDIYRGMPAIYANYYGYDEVAHGDGPLGREAVRALHRIDSHIRQVEAARRKYWPETELYVCSDHGMTPATPFSTLDVKEALGPFVARNVRASVVWDEATGAAGWGVPASNRPASGGRWLPAEGVWLLDELDAIEAHLSRRGRRLAQALRRRLRERLPPDPALGWDLARGSDVIVRSSGSLAHIYFNVTAERMDVSEVAILYPDLVDALAHHPGIGLVLGQEAGRPVMVGARGTTALTSDRLPPGLADPGQAVANLARLIDFPHSGDLVVLGAWSAAGRGAGSVVGFEEHAATHGGLGGPQNYPFFITPPDAPLDLTTVTNSQALYPYFMARYQAQGPRAGGAREQAAHHEPEEAPPSQATRQ